MKRALAVALLGLALAGAPVHAADDDVELARLRAELSALAGDPALGGLAAAERLQAEQALQALAQAKRRDRPHALFVAERRVALAQAVAQAELAGQQRDQLARERDQILLDAARRDAELARLEAEKLRLQSLARAEEAERARSSAEAARAMTEASMAEAEQARRLADAQAREAALARREAELAGAAADSLRSQLQATVERSDARGQVMTLSGSAFAPGRATLLPDARDNLGNIVGFIARYPGRRVRIEGHTDSRGGDNLNQALSQQRAEAVRDALVAAGVDADRLEAVGFGKDRPVASNDSEDGRARNRRVDIVVLESP